MTTILLADDHRVVREGLRTLLSQEADLSVIGEAADGREVVELARSLHPDVIIMDIAMPEMNGIEATRLIVAENPAIRVVALSMYADRRFVMQILRAGDLGYVLKEAAFEELAHSEGIIPALESAHAMAYVSKTAPLLPKDTLIIANLSGRGDKDVEQASKFLL